MSDGEFFLMGFLGALLLRFYDVLDNYVFPSITAFATHRLHISLMVCLWMALLLCGSFTAFELVGGNYTNGLSGLLGCIILMQQQKHQASTDKLHDKVAAMHAENVSMHAKLHKKIDALRGDNADADTNTTTDIPVA